MKKNTKKNTKNTNKNIDSFVSATERWWFEVKNHCEEEGELIYGRMGPALAKILGRHRGEEANPYTCSILVANKVDKEMEGGGREVEEDEGLRWAAARRLFFHETSMVRDNDPHFNRTKNTVTGVYTLKSTANEALSLVIDRVMARKLRLTRFSYAKFFPQDVIPTYEQNEEGYEQNEEGYEEYQEEYQEEYE